jgi:glycosyltransferase involved in cell wall biosynthesis
MHVLYFHQHFSTPSGSTGTRSYEMARRLIARGHTVTMVCGSGQMASTGLTGKPAAGMRRGMVDGINIIELSLPYSNYDSFLKRVWIFLRYAWCSAKLALRLNYDLLFATSTPLTAGIPGIVMKLFRKKPFVFEVRDLWPELPREMGVITNPLILKAMDILEWLSYNSADACIGLSPGIVRGITRRNIPVVQTTMIPNGCDLELFKPSGHKQVGKLNIPGIDKDDFVAIFCGAHGMANGLDAVLDAAKVLKTQNVRNIKLLFVGDGKLKPRLRERAEKEHLDNCVFLDPVPKKELAKITAAVDVGLMILANVSAFYYGTSPNKFFDYIASGLPVLNNYPGWLAELITKHDCGTAVPPEDPVAFAEALVALRDNPDRLHQAAANARKLAESDFNREKLADKFVCFLEEHVILQGHAKNQPTPLAMKVPRDVETPS